MVNAEIGVDCNNRIEALNETEFLSNMKAHQGIIYKLVHLYAYSQEDKKDLYQEIVLQAWKGIASFRGEGKFSTWLYRVCLNTIFTIRRKTNRIQYTDTLDEGSIVAESAEDEKERLHKAIRTLPETERAIISLHLDGYDNREMADLLGITANLVGVKLHRAKQLLTNMLSNI